MTTYALSDSELASLAGKTVLITGGATGIGKATVELAHQHGANVVIGDWNASAAANLADQLGAERTMFRQCDVSQWDDVLELFQAAWKRFGEIDVVLANAGVNERTPLLQDEVDKQTGKLLPPDLTTLNVNLVGVAYTVKAALHYMQKWPQKRCQLVLTASAASFLDTPPLYLYCAAKAGVLGLMRGLRTQLPKTNNVTINVVAPWMTRTPMLLPEFEQVWEGLPANDPIGVARALLLPAVRPDVNGKAFFVAGHEIVDFEDTLAETQPLWMGRQLADHVNEGQRRLIP